MISVYLEEMSVGGGGESSFYIVLQHSICYIVLY